jgi:hypothetical protein
MPRPFPSNLYHKLGESVLDASPVQEDGDDDDGGTPLVEDRTVANAAFSLPLLRADDDEATSD